MAVRWNLSRDPKVLYISRKLGLTPQCVQGWIIEFWGWVSQHMETGRVNGVWVEDVLEDLGFWREQNVSGSARTSEQSVSVAAFADALQEVGWVENIDVDGRCMEVPQFERWFSQSGKRRLRQARHAANHRAKKASQSPTKPAKSREQTRSRFAHQRREEERIVPPLGDPPREESDMARWLGYARQLPAEVRPAWDAFLRSRQSGQRKESLVQNWLAKVERVCQSAGASAAAQMLDECIGWKGIPPDVVARYAQGGQMGRQDGAGGSATERARKALEGEA